MRSIRPQLVGILVVASAVVMAAMSPALGATEGPGYSWGANMNGRTGTGTPDTDDVALPTALAAPGSFTKIAAGWNHGCALGSGITAFCWGHGDSGQLGNGTTDSSLSPVAVTVPSLGFADMSAGYNSTCAIENGLDHAYCWGYGASGQLGNGFVTDATTPVAVLEPTPMSGFTSIGVGRDSACAVANDFGYCWGENGSGQLGNGTTGDSNAPVLLASFTSHDADLGYRNVKGVSVYGPNVYAATDGGLSISTNWGSTFINKTTANGLGSIEVNGVNAIGSTVVAATTLGLSISTDSGTSFHNKTTSNGLGSNGVNGVFAVEAASTMTIYAATNGGLSISTDWGSTFTNHTTGLGSPIVRGVFVAGSTVYVATNGGLSISTDGGSTFTNRTTIDGLGDNVVLDVYAVGSTVYAATTSGLSISTDGGSTFTNRTTANGLGSNYVNGLFALGSTVYAATAGGLSISTDGGSTFTKATTANGLGNSYVYDVQAVSSTVYAGFAGGLAISSAPIYRYNQISVGDSFGCGVTYDPGAGAGAGPGVCWGYNWYGQLGDGTDSNWRSFTQPIFGGHTWTKIVTGASHTCGLDEWGDAYCWGKNLSGQLGINSAAAFVATPTQVTMPGGGPVRDISAGSDSTCAITDTATYCWGSASAGQLGNGSTSGVSRVPVAVNLSTIDAADSAVQVTSGQGYNAVIVKPRMLWPSGTAFTSVQAGQSTATTVYAKNNRPWALDITGTSVTGSGVSITSSTCTGTLAVGALCSVDVSWSPSAGGALTSSLTIDYDGTSSSTPLTGASTAAPEPAPEPAPTSASSATPTPSSSETPLSEPAATPSSIASTPSAALPSAAFASLRGPVSRVTWSGSPSVVPTRVSRPPATTLSRAPVVRGRAGDIVRVGVVGLQPRRTVRVDIGIGGRWSTLGSSTTGARGGTTLPAFTSSRPGNFPLRLKTGGAEDTYVRVIVTR